MHFRIPSILDFLGRLVVLVKAVVQVVLKVKVAVEVKLAMAMKIDQAGGPCSSLVIYVNTNTHLWLEIKSIFADEAGDGCDSLSASDSKSKTETSSQMCKVIVGSSNSFYF